MRERKVYKFVKAEKTKDEKQNNNSEKVNSKKRKAKGTRERGRENDVKIFETRENTRHERKKEEPLTQQLRGKRKKKNQKSKAKA